MPIYEYFCDDCQQSVEVFFRHFSDVDTKQPICPNCQGSQLSRLISRVTVVDQGKQSTSGQVAASNSPQAETDAADPQALARIMRQSSYARGKNPDNEFNEVVSRLERGEKASTIENSLRKRKGEKPQTH